MAMTTSSVRPPSVVNVALTAPSTSSSSGVTPGIATPSTLGSPVFGALQEALGWNMAGIVLQIPAYVISFVLCLFILPRGKDVKTLDDVPAEEAWPRGF